MTIIYRANEAQVAMSVMALATLIASVNEIEVQAVELTEAHFTPEEDGIKFTFPDPINTVTVNSA